MSRKRIATNVSIVLKIAMTACAWKARPMSRPKVRRLGAISA